MSPTGDKLDKAAARTQSQRDRILKAAQQSFIRHGFHAAGMAGIAQAAQMSPGLIYRYFDSKNAIILAIIERQLAEKKAKGHSSVKELDAGKRKVEPANYKNLATTKFQEFVRLKARACATCNYVFTPADPARTKHAGHFVERGKESTRALIFNCHPQCQGCNCVKGAGKSGKPREHAIYIDDRYSGYMAQIVAEFPQLQGRWFSHVLHLCSLVLLSNARSYYAGELDRLKVMMVRLKNGEDYSDLRKEVEVEHIAQIKSLLKIYFDGQ